MLAPNVKQVAYILKKRGPAQATKENSTSARLNFLNYLAFHRLKADRTDSAIPWVVSLGRSYGFLRADSNSKKKVRRSEPTPAYSAIDGILKVLVNFRRVRRVQVPMPQI
jgi:hypothetical protein